LQQYDISRENVGELLLRIMFLFLVGMVVNRFAVEYREQVRRYQNVSETLREANRSLRQAQAEARRAERLAALGQLSAGLAHEIRNPLGVIKGSAELLEQKVATSDSVSQELAGFIYTEVNRLSALVGRFLDFARPSKLERHPEDVREVMERALKALAQQNVPANIRIIREFPETAPPVMLDPELTEQVFINLLSNACEAMGENGGELRLKIYPEPGEDSTDAKMVVEVEDTGPGVPAEMREQIFNPFVTTKKTGVGLGLAIVSKIVDAHGGSVTLRDVPEQGACFRLVFPVGTQAYHGDAEKIG
jgi:signal transduction histidine kinase